MNLTEDSYFIRHYRYSTGPTAGSAKIIVFSLIPESTITNVTFETGSPTLQMENSSSCRITEYNLSEDIRICNSNGKI